MKVTRRQLRQTIKEELSLLESDSNADGKLDPDELRNLAGDLEGTRSKPWAWEQPDDHSETSAEEAGMAAHFRENKDEIMNDRALALAKKIAHMFPQAGLGSVSEEELPILARHILAVKAELDPLKPWNK